MNINELSANLVYSNNYNFVIHLIHFQRRRERGRIHLKGVRLVEEATVSGEGGDPFAPDVSSQKWFGKICFINKRSNHQGYPFQVGYCEISASANSHQLENGNGGGVGIEGQQSGRAVPQYTLYVIANSEKERSEWIRAIRQGEPPLTRLMMTQ